MHNSHGTQIFSARSAILLSIELAPSLKDNDEDNRVYTYNFRYTLFPFRFPSSV